MSDIPECFCNEEAMSSCDWTFEANCKYYREGDSEDAPGSIRNGVDWKLENIPQVLAQLIFQTTVQAINEKGLEVYLSWVDQCFGENSDQAKMARELGAKVLK